MTVVEVTTDLMPVSRLVGDAMAIGERAFQSTVRTAAETAGFTVNEVFARAWGQRIAPHKQPDGSVAELQVITLTIGIDLETQDLEALEVFDELFMPDFPNSAWRLAPSYTS
jgi:3-hydroxyacyl-CoA dehydrogenase